jgi:hypothetical protein
MAGSTPDSQIFDLSRGNLKTAQPNYGSAPYRWKSSSCHLGLTTPISFSSSTERGSPSNVWVGLASNNQLGGRFEFAGMNLSRSTAKVFYAVLCLMYRCFDGKEHKALQAC